MRIPPLYEKPGWQRFFAGVAVGAVISWFVFLYQFGEMQEKQVRKIINQQSEIKTLRDHKNTLIEDYEKLNEENKKKLKIQDFKIEFVKYPKNEFDSLALLTLSDKIKADLNYLIAKDIENAAKNKELIKKVIEHEYPLNDKTYKLQLYSIYFDTTIEMSIIIELVK